MQPVGGDGGRPEFGPSDCCHESDETQHSQAHRVTVRRDPATHICMRAEARSLGTKNALAIKKLHRGLVGWNEGGHRTRRTKQRYVDDDNNDDEKREDNEEHGHHDAPQDGQTYTEQERRFESIKCISSECIS
eukprot:CAMPEP_0195022870 /NCGR_PEP_ID=MMETSP0326_2-20130528/41586_1 /TAXON_ID=2866 ORGANISM="Crypthecodinium cohnii, Strain Seligo" /NCGR_SAMPLE_ID=MMETSP0326_2 /ASSEMBLY_ACC=CAM_ASM_000348 /LENGTH=132 /DNA_ID=CAMNT_0040042891 /DNA_START=42 /DNA_END=436 /DNA_ORIENTATION=-